MRGPLLVGGLGPGLRDPHINLVLGGNRTQDLLIASPTPYRYAIRHIYISDKSTMNACSLRSVEDWNHRLRLVRVAQW